MQCDMCGEDKPLVDTEIEGTTMKVCRGCVRYGKIVPMARPVQRAEVKQFKRQVMPELIESIVDDYDIRIKNARERKGLKQEEIAKRISEKESLIHKMESKHFEPSVRLAKKLEHALGIKLVEQSEAPRVATEKSESASVTLGDVIKIRKR